MQCGMRYALRRNSGWFFSPAAFGLLIEWCCRIPLPVRPGISQKRNGYNCAPPWIFKLREEELEEARAIQSVMLPAELLHAGRVSISHAFQPMAEVGGDFLDYFELTDGSVGLYVGDVSGKGLPAAMYAALAVGTLRVFTRPGSRLAMFFRC